MKIFFRISLLLLLATPFTSLQSQSPVAFNDTLHVYKLDDTLTINVLLNDLDPEGDPLSIFQCPGALSHTDSTITYVISYLDNWQKSGLQFFKYYVITDNQGHYSDPAGKIFIHFHIPWYDYLDINLVKARINCNGNHFWNPEGGAEYIVPKTSDQSALFSFGFIAGGLDAGEELHLAGQRYNSDKMDFWPGPVTDISQVSNMQDSIWNRVWKLNRSEVEYHRHHWWQSGYQLNPVIANWPGNGDTALGQADQLAPFYDLNANGLYEPLAGDYPLIKGDQTVFFILNDTRRPHTETGGIPMGIEIHGMAYAFDCTSDSALLYTTFLHYDIYNRSYQTYHNAWFGTFVDTDLGYAWDDYVGSDVKRGSFFTYNGQNIDGGGQPGAYGAFPPAVSSTVLAGPFLDPDNLDNPNVDPFGTPLCDMSMNGAYFGDGIPDNERVGMTSFLLTNNCGSGPTCDPQNDMEYYRTIQGFWRDGVHAYYGAGGHPNSGAGSTACNFMFPALSDPCNYGTNGQQPAGYLTGAGGGGLIWNEQTAGNVPDDRRGLIGMGPFSFQPGSMQQLDLAFVWARQYTDSSATAVIPLLGERIDQIRTFFLKDSTPCGGVFSGIKPPALPVKGLRLYPNPSANMLLVEYPVEAEEIGYVICNILGEIVSNGKFSESSLHTIPVQNLQPGVYVLTLIGKHQSVSARFIKQ